ncbi:MAG TPA: WG repeat-containing protein, partial [Blastocatellia bacterium]|nr:WG repeat-containing protein [Blastocatellia bacterium]
MRNSLWNLWACHRGRSASVLRLGGLIPLLLLLLAAQTHESATLFPILKHGKWGYARGTGEIVISPQFDHAAGFSEGFALVTLGHKWGFVDERGKLVARPQFDWAWAFSGGLAAVKVKDEWGFLDRTGQLAIQPKFADAGSFHEGLAPVSVVQSG